MPRREYPVALCGGCGWGCEKDDTGEHARKHESDTGHRVFMWDTPTSLLPREAWGSVAVWTR